jgi:hypothetical protein
MSGGEWRRQFCSTAGVSVPQSAVCAERCPRGRTSKDPWPCGSMQEAVTGVFTLGAVDKNEAGEGRGTVWASRR